MEYLFKFCNFVTGVPACEDLFHSDTQTGSTPTYVWLADQFGHMFIGFGGLFLFTWAAATLSGRTVPGYALSPREDGKSTLPRSVIWIIAIGILAVYAYKEWGDLSDAAAGEGLWLKSLPGIWDSDLLWDSVTDFSFVAIGLILALAHFGLFGIHPSLVLAAMIVCMVVLIRAWLPSFYELGKADVPHFARINTVKLIPAPPETNETLPSQCEPYKESEKAPLQCVAEGTCTKTHFVLYGFKKGELPADEDQFVNAGLPDPNGPRHQTRTPSPVVIRVMSELRNLGVALVAEHVFRRGGRKGRTIRYSTLYHFAEDRGSSTPSSEPEPAPQAGVDTGGGSATAPTLVIDNIEKDLALFLLRIRSGIDQKATALEELLGEPQHSLRDQLSRTTVVWVALKENRAIELCEFLNNNAGAGVRIKMIHAKLPDEIRKTLIASKTDGSQ